jgi:hypothetical protein
MGEWVLSSIILTLALDGEWSVLRPGRFLPGERAPSTRCIGDWVAPRADLDAVEKRMLSCPYR